MQRIAKAISDAGICSRRKAELLVTEGAVKLNDIVVTSLSTKVDGNSIIKINDEIINPYQKPRLWLYYKPIGLITTHQDPDGRKTVFENLTKLPRVISVGRLDLNSEGLLLLTNKGELARKLELPSTALERVYKVRAHGNLRPLLQNFAEGENNLNQINKSIIIDGIIYKPKSIRLIQLNKSNAWFEVILTEGKNREIRRIFEYFNLKINRLIRIKYGPFFLGNLKAGKTREIPFSEFKKFL